ELDKPLPMAEASLGKTFPQHLELVVSKLLQVNADERYQSAAELRRALEHLDVHDNVTATKESASPTKSKTTIKLSLIVVGTLLVASILFVVVKAKRQPASPVPAATISKAETAQAISFLPELPEKSLEQPKEP